MTVWRVKNFKVMGVNMLTHPVYNIKLKLKPLYLENACYRSRVFWATLPVVSLIFIELKLKSRDPDT